MVEQGFKCSVTVMSRSPDSAAKRLPGGVEIVQGDCNMSWDEMLHKFRELSGRKEAKFVQLPDSALAGMMRMGGLAQSLFKAKAGLDFAKLLKKITSILLNRSNF